MMKSTTLFRVYCYAKELAKITNSVMDKYQDADTKQLPLIINDPDAETEIYKWAEWLVEDLCKLRNEE